MNNMGKRESVFECKREGLRIRGKQIVPACFDERQRYPAIIFSHGFTGNYTEMESFCKAFALKGYVTFCFSFCGGGCLYEETDLKSDGKTTEMSVMTEVKDLTAVMAYVRSLPYVDEKRLILAGGSQGGFVSGLAAARYGEWVKRLIMIFPALCIPDHARMGCLGGASYDPNDVPDQIDCGRSILGRHFHDEMAEFDPFLELARYKGPVLILHGLNDEIVHYTYSIRAKENYEGGQCELQLIEGMGHGMDEEQRQHVVLAIERFLKGGENDA